MRTNRTLFCADANRSLRRSEADDGGADERRNVERVRRKRFILPREIPVESVALEELRQFLADDCLRRTTRLYFARPGVALVAQPDYGSTGDMPIAAASRSDVFCQFPFDSWFLDDVDGEAGDFVRKIEGHETRTVRRSANRLFAYGHALCAIPGESPLNGTDIESDVSLIAVERLLHAFHGSACKSRAVAVFQRQPEEFGECARRGERRAGIGVVDSDMGEREPERDIHAGASANGTAAPSDGTAITGRIPISATLSNALLSISGHSAIFISLSPYLHVANYMDDYITNALAVCLKQPKSHLVLRKRKPKVFQLRRQGLCGFFANVLWFQAAYRTDNYAIFLSPIGRT